MLGTTEQRSLFQSKNQNYALLTHAFYNTIRVSQGVIMNTWAKYQKYLIFVDKCIDCSCGYWDRPKGLFCS